MYYKMYAESLEGEEAQYYCEVIGGLVVRQIYTFNGNVFWANEKEEENSDYPLGDNLEFDEELVDCERISLDEFEMLWPKSIDQ